MCGQSELQDEIEVVDDVSQSRLLTDVTLPHGLTLHVGRVGQRVTYGNDVVPGETVRFNYEGGSDEGAERNVLVVKVDDEGFEGLTLERDGDYRRYSDGHISGLYNILIVEPFIKATVESQSPSHGNVKRVRFDEAGDALLASLSGEALAALYLTHVALRGDSAEFDAKTGEVVITLPQPKVSKFTKVDHYEIVIENKRGERLEIFPYAGEDEVGLNSDVTGTDNTNITPEQLRDELVKFLA